MDLMLVQPKGVNGEAYILTAIDVATRYPLFRAGADQDAVTLAEQILDIRMDMGVVPAIIHSDNQFLMMALDELLVLMGVTQIFSTALRPQSQGIAERCHLEIRRGLAILVEAYVQANPRKWPRYVRWLETKLRHKTVCEGTTPYAAVHGFWGRSWKVWFTRSGFVSL